MADVTGTDGAKMASALGRVNGGFAWLTSILQLLRTFHIAQYTMWNVQDKQGLWMAVSTYAWDELMQCLLNVSFPALVPFFLFAYRLQFTYPAMGGVVMCVCVCVSERERV